ncbi:MAG: hypothetical protein ACTSWC_01365 [Promethearchaeota archaeon]
MPLEHTTLDLDYDRPLLEDVFDEPDLRYVSLYMYIVRRDLFQDMLDDDLLDSYESLLSLEDPTVGDLKRLCSNDFIKNLINFHLITNIKSFQVLEAKPNHHKIRMAPGLKIAHESLNQDEEEVHIFMTESVIERIIAPIIPEMTQTRIVKALKRLRGMMCPRTSVVHSLVHRYGDYWVLDDDYYYIIEELGNPYQALRIELMIRQMVAKYQEIQKRIDTLLSVFNPDLPKAKMMKKFIEAEKKSKDSAKSSKIPNYLDYLIKKSRKKSLPNKFQLEFTNRDIPEIYRQWKESFNLLIDLRLKFRTINEDMQKLQAYYSGKNQIMPYLTFIQKTTYDEDDISSKIRDSLITARNKLKYITQQLDQYSIKDLKMLNLDLDRYIIEEDLLPDENDE